ncbi:hypothetical protein [Aeromicrobium wangtongii]|uniref:Uncharacterized protein n=1 Tax=Aeromicrobium wangtongii TaxID=2969247 RepID=A0ABY5M7P4_9ACTN|nr:hypothetical protein [Aeromicrobium wangtongii]MCD9199008.1 hypothetical protein [Aeromicrobium wangtongii]MCL3819931.1 hypothetical protein [Aeromicrobium wangtongii]UUP12959.1 hypothetical protein NQV15_14000 [Aeromicrobium wangtongii]
MRTRSWRVLVAAVAGFALVGAGTTTAQAATHSSFENGDTRVVVAPEVYKLVAGAGIKPSAIKPATAGPAGSTLAARFPISSINVSKLQISHTGGIKLAAGKAKISLRNFKIDVNKLRVYGKVSGSKANAKSALLFTLESSDRTKYGPLKLVLTKTSAGALNATFGVDAFAKGATFGYAKVRPKG